MDIHKKFSKEFDFGAYQCNTEHDSQIEFQQFIETRLIVNEMTYKGMYSWWNS